MDWKTYLPGAYLALFFVSIGLIYWAASKRRARRAPFKAATKVLRQPGESLRKKIAELDDKFVDWLLLAALGPLVVGGLFLYVAGLVAGWWILVVLGIGAVVFALAFTWAARWCAKKLFERANHELGWFGERVVGDLLAPLERQGWRVFHDVPREGRGQTFNVDHVAIGPGGIFVIETKTRRKKAQSDEGHVVVFDGKVLTWPWGTDRSGIDQAIDNANWLQQWLKKATGEDLRVEPILTFPDWFVKEKSESAIRVVNSSWIPGILAAKTGMLTEKQIDLAARQLDGVCRDVEY
ncbi:MAG: nuclease-related domain-containing protein [Opitutaceae bacterium]